MSATVRERGAPPDQSVGGRWIAVSLLLHAALIAALLGWWQPLPPPEITPPVVRMIFDAPGSSGTAGGGGGAGHGAASAAAAPAEAPSETAQAEAEAAPEAPAETATPTPTPPKITASPPPVPTPEPVPVPQPTPAPTVTAAPKLALAPPPPVPSRKPTPPHATAAPQPQPAPLPPPAPAFEALAPAPAPSAPSASVATATAAPGAGSGPGGTQGQGQGREGLGQGFAGTGPLVGPGDDYLAALQRWLARYKKYPDEAIARKEEGKVIVGFVLKRDGTVLSAWIVRSSGVPVLDQAALALMHNASPVPPVPQRYLGTELTLAMPIDYSIGFFDKLFR